VSMAVERPIFVIGCGRSGTTLLYDIMCGHRSLSWFSNYTDRWPGVPQLAALSRAYPALRRLELSPSRIPAPIPSEGYRIFDHCSPRSSADNNRPLTEADARDTERLCLARIIEAHQRSMGGHRFINKNTRNTRRIRFLRALFPDAIFIHVVRDPRATVASLLRVAFWPSLHFWWREDRTASELVEDGMLPEQLAAELWVHEVASARRDKEVLDASAYMEIRYEDLIADPRAEVRNILAFVRLPWTSSFESVFRTFSIEDRTEGYRFHLDAGQIELIEDVTGPAACTFGYLDRSA
jgi:omega-hydroxy-beta-dihydromenaquinone-9 sulfotransferase